MSPWLRLDELPLLIRNARTVALGAWDTAEELRMAAKDDETLSSALRLRKLARDWAREAERLADHWLENVKDVAA